MYFTQNHTRVPKTVAIPKDAVTSKTEGNNSLIDRSIHICGSRDACILLFKIRLLSRLKQLNECVLNHEKLPVI